MSNGNYNSGDIRLSRFLGEKVLCEYFHWTPRDVSEMSAKKREMYLEYLRCLSRKKKMVDLQNELKWGR